MKQLNVILLLFIFSLSILSCKKNNDQVASQQEGVKSDTQLPVFDEKNSVKLTWDQLPDNLRNAIPVETLKGAKELTNAVAPAYQYWASIGAWGGSGGTAFSFLPPTNTSKIYAIAIRSGSLIDGLIVWYINSAGTIYVAKEAGGSGGTMALQVLGTDEYINYVGGYTGAAYLNNLRMSTNKKTFSYGTATGTSFSFSVPLGYQALGFFGASGAYIDRLGFYLYSR